MDILTFSSLSVTLHLKIMVPCSTLLKHPLKKICYSKHASDSHRFNRAKALCSILGTLNEGGLLMVHLSNSSWRVTSLLVILSVACSGNESGSQGEAGLAEIVAGPVMGALAPTSAKVWVRTALRQEVEVRIHANSEDLPFSRVEVAMTIAGAFGSCHS